MGGRAGQNEGQDRGQGLGCAAKLVDGSVPQDQETEAAEGCKRPWEEIGRRLPGL